MLRRNFLKLVAAFGLFPASLLKVAKAPPDKFPCLLTGWTSNSETEFVLHAIHYFNMPWSMITKMMGCVCSRNNLRLIDVKAEREIPEHGVKLWRASYTFTRVPDPGLYVKANFGELFGVDE
jgi:hypothetical protein